MSNLYVNPRPPIQENIQQSMGVILLIGIDVGQLNTAIWEEFGSQYRVISVLTLEESEKLLSLENIKVICLGLHCLSQDSLDFVKVKIGDKPAVPCIVLADEIDEEMLPKSRLFYTMRRVSPAKDIIAILSSAAAAHQNGLKIDVHHQFDPADIEDIDKVRELLDLTRNVALQNDVSAACELVTESLSQLFCADHGYCLNYDADSRMLNSASSYRIVQFRHSVSAGLLGFVALTGCSANVAYLKEDSRYLHSVDDLGAGDQARLLACPIHDAQGRLQAILALVRATSKSAFSEQDEKALSFLAQHLAAPLSRLKLEAQLEERSFYLQHATNTKTDAYRAEAVAHYTNSKEKAGDILFLSPRWTRWVYYLLLLFIGVALIYSALIKVTEYADGPAVILFSGYIHDVAPVACRTDATGKGQQPNPTEASALRDERHPSLIAFIPGKYRPELQPGMNLRLKLRGFQYVYQKLTVDCVGEQMMSPAQAKRYLPSDSIYNVSLSGPVVPVFATVPSTTFEVSGRHYAYYDGMGATVEAATSSERLIYALVPGLNHWLERNGG